MTLAGYIFGKNDKQDKMAMTMPVLFDSSGRMHFFMGNDKVINRHIYNTVLFVCKVGRQ